MELRWSVMRQMIIQKRENFDAHSPHTRDDDAVIQQPKMNVLSISMIVNVKRQEYKLPIVDDEEETIAADQLESEATK